MSKRTLSFAGLAALAVAAVLLGGCGGGGSSDASGESAGQLSATTKEAAGGRSSGEGGETAGSTTSESPQSQGGGEGGGEEAEGSGGGESASGGSKADFVNEADAICAQSSGQIGGELQKYLSNGLQGLSKEAPAFVSEVLAPRLEAEVADIEALEAPASAAKAEEAVLAEIQGLQEKAEANPAGFITDGGATFEAEEAVEKYGFQSCGGI